MKKFTRAIAAIMLMTAAIIAVGCGPEDDPKNGGENNEVTVAVTTVEPSEITTTTAVCGSKAVVSDGGTLDKLGICWAFHENPTLNDLHQYTKNGTNLSPMSLLT